MNKQLQNKLKTYSALTAVVGLATSSADAAIIHTNVNYTGGYETYNIDVDGDGTNDFAIHGANWGACYGIAGNLINIENFGSNLAMATSYFYFPQLLGSGANISSGQTFGAKGYVWSGGCNGYLSNGVYFAGTYNGNPQWGSGHGATSIIGVRFDVGGNTHYGWLRISTSSNLSSWTLVDMAFNCVPDQGLTAGQTTGGTAPVADMATLSDVTDECSATPSAPTATSDCGVTLTGTPDVSFPITAQGTTVVTWTYDDGYGNTSTQAQNVIIDDVTAPVADAGSLADVDSCDPINSVGDLTAPTATDNCAAGSVIGTTSATFPINSSTTITWTYDDGNGNTSTQDQNINITTVDAGVTQVGNTLTADEATGGTTYQWVDCDNSNAPIGGETNQSFTPSVSGNYAVEVTLNGCTVTSSCTSVTVVGVSENGKQTTKLHPNPATDIITIDLAELQPNTTMTIVDVTGKVVKESVVTNKRNTINLSEFSVGVYFVKITSEQGTNTVKFVKK